MARSKFITVEGGEGVGKTSNIATITACLDEANIDYITTREPGGTKLAEKIRSLILSEWYEKVAPKTELLLFYAARIQHIENVIVPALNDGKWVVCDRFYDATIAYQGGGREIPQEIIAPIQDWAVGDFTPNLTILLDAPVEVALSRIQARQHDRIEQESKEFFNRIREKYLDIATNDPERVKIIDAAQDLDKVQADLRELINNYIKI